LEPKLVCLKISLERFMSEGVRSNVTLTPIFVQSAYVARTVSLIEGNIIKKDFIFSLHIEIGFV